MTYKDYMREVDRELTAICGLDHTDLGDTVYFHDRHQDEVPPREVAEELLENDGFPMDCLED